MLGPKHGPPAVCGKSITVQPYDVDVTGPGRHALAQNLASTFTNASITALDDLVVRLECEVRRQTRVSFLP